MNEDKLLTVEKGLFYLCEPHGNSKAKNLEQWHGTLKKGGGEPQQITMGNH